MNEDLQHCLEVLVVPFFLLKVNLFKVSGARFPLKICCYVDLRKNHVEKSIFWNSDIWKQYPSWPKLEVKPWKTLSFLKLFSNRIQQCADHAFECSYTATIWHIIDIYTYNKHPSTNTNQQEVQERSLISGEVVHARHQTRMTRENPTAKKQGKGMRTSATPPWQCWISI